MAYPLVVVVTQDNAQSQQAFAVAAHRAIAHVQRVSPLVTEEGLRILGCTELDLEFVVHELTRHFAGIRCSNPQVIYQAGPPMLEPFYRAVIDTPEDCWDALMADMSDRRGIITAIAEIPIGKRFVAVVPVSECFGYSTVLRILTEARGTHAFEFSHYGRVGDDDVA